MNELNKESVICKNCNNEFAGNFCNNCGQKADFHRLNLSHLLHDLFHAFTHLDKGFLFSAKELVVRPGHTIREYLLGKRSKHSNPLVMILIIGGLCSYLYKELDIEMVNSIKLKSLEGPLHYLVSKFFAVDMIFYCLIYAIIDYLIFSYKGYNYIEFLVLNLFLASEVLFLYIIMIPVWLIGEPLGINFIIRLLFAFIFLLYLIYVRYQFFDAANDKKVKIRLSVEFLIFMGFILVNILKTLKHFT
jgi:hypothetical protein